MKAAALSAVTLLFAGCVRETMDTQAGQPVRFGAHAEPSVITRASYSGVVTPSNVERIDWEDGDMVRIMSDEVTTSPKGKCYDYDLIPSTGAGGAGYASAEPHGDARGFVRGRGARTYWACYPSPSSPSPGIQGGLDMFIDNGSAVVTAVIPANQSAHGAKQGADGYYYANMDLAYMVAASPISDGAEVTLPFTSIVTTFYVTLLNTTGATATLKKVSLSSESGPLNGKYRARLDNVTAPGAGRNCDVSYTFLSGSSYASSLPRTESNSTVYAKFDGLEIPPGSSVTVALFTIPHGDVTGLTLSVTTDETETVHLPLKYADGGHFISFARERKHNISNAQMPAVTYEISVMDASAATGIGRLEYDRSGAARSFSVVSTKTVGGVPYAAPWKAQVKVADTGVDADDWADMDASNTPAWMAGFPLTSADVAAAPASGTGAGHYQVTRTVAPQPLQSHVDRLKAGRIWTDDTHTAEVDNSTPANAVDLSRYNFVTREMESARYTANTYVISKPGWYKFPCVYGNAIENGATVEDSYRGRMFTVNHLDSFKKMNDFPIYTNGPWLEMHGTVNYHRFTDLVWQKWTVWDGAAGQAVTSGKNQGRSLSFGPEPDPQVIRNIGYENDAYDASEAYVIFYVDPDNIRPGNALIATKEDTLLSSDDKITWTWHIWITDQDMTPVVVGNGVQSYGVLPVNLGWIDDRKGLFYPEVSDRIRFVNMADGVERCVSAGLTVVQPETEDVSTSGWQTYYQWGRKDPFTTGVTTTASTDHLLYKSILNPDVMFWEESTADGVSYIDWTSANYNNLWDSKCTTYGTPGGSLPNHKTVYDPSPRRFCIPPEYTFRGFATNAYGYEGDFSGGYFFRTGDPASPETRTLFFPASGWAYYNSADCSVSDQGTGGYYWTYHATTNTQTRVSYALKFTGGGSASVNPVYSDQYTHRANGYSVRPVMFDESQAHTPDDGTSVVVFDFTAMWGDGTGSGAPPSNLRNLAVQNAEDPDIVLTFLYGRDNGSKQMTYEYTGGEGSVVLYDSYHDIIGQQHINGFTISSGTSGKNIVQIDITFAQQGDPSFSSDKSSYSEGTWVDQDGTQAGADYSQTPPVWSGGETAVTFETGITGSTPWKVSSVTVYYY